MMFFKQNLFLTVALVLVTSMLGSCSTSPVHLAGDAGPIRVACVGDSITYGYGLTDREQNSYPAQLQDLLREDWEVRNFGFNGATALKRGTKPYTALPTYSDALSYRPQIVLIKLGTNDTNAKSWPSYKDEFLSDYREIVHAFRSLESRPRIYLCLPVPIFRDRGKAYDTDKILVEEVIPKIKQLAREERLPVIDLYAGFEGKESFFPDGVHPDVAGAGIIATTIQSTLVSARKN